MTPKTVRNIACSRSKLQGAAYFGFFALFCLGAFVLYLPVAMRYEEKTHL